jgi:parvulin-like peptidyl-prolyl isomerase
VARLRAGEKFQDLVRQYSDNTLTVKDEGFYGTFTRGMLNKTVEDLVFNQQKNYVSDPIRLGANFEILKVLEKTNGGQATFDEVQNEINSKLSEPIVQPRVRTYLTNLRQNAFLQIKAGYIDSGAAPGKDTSWKDPAQLKPQTTTKEAVAATQHHIKKLWGVIPYGRTPAVKDKGDAAPPEVAPVPAAPVKNADGSPSPQ